MPIFGVNMAVPIKTNVRESQIYFLGSSENVPPPNLQIDGKYLIFKILEMILSLCSLMLFAYSIKATENEIVDMLSFITMGAVTIYPLLFVLLSINIRTRPVCAITFNVLAATSFLVISASRMSSSWTKARHFYHDNYKEKYVEALMELRSSILISIAGILYTIESLIMCIEIKRNPSNNP